MTVHVRWSLGREVDFEVPYPARGVRFLGRDGRVLPDGEIVQVDRLGGVAVRAFSSRPGRFFEAEAVLEANDLLPHLSRQLWASERLAEVAPGRHELDLRALQQACQSLLSMTRDVDATVTVRVLNDTRESQGRRLRVRTYDVELQPEKVTGHVVLPGYDRHRVGEGTGEQVRLETFFLGDPAAEPDPLRLVEPFRWDFRPESRAAGPWLITGQADGRGVTRPLCWTVFDGAGEERDPVPDEDFPLQRAISLPGAEERADAIRGVLEVLARDPGHDDWVTVEAYLDRLADLPPGTFDVTSLLAASPGAAAMSLLRSGPDRFGGVWDTLERLPFTWLMVPVSDWVSGARLRFEHLRQELEAVADGLGPEADLDQLARGGFRSFLDEVPLRAPGMKAMIQLVAHRVLGEGLGDQQELAMACSAQGRGVLCRQVLEDARRDLLRIHAEDRWPGRGEITEWFRHRWDLPEELRGLYLDPPVGAGFRAPVLNVPIAAGLSASLGAPLPEGAVFHVRRIREFDPGWFEAAYGCALAAGVGWLLEQKEGILDG